VRDRVYLDFYKLREMPFAITPDPAFLFLSNTHQSVIDKILHGIRSRMGFILLTGEVGTGKTTLCRSILDNLDGEAETAYIINPSLSGKELISNILDDLGIKCPPNSSKKDLIDKLNLFLLSTANTRPVVVIIDDAQTMPLDAIEDLRLLSNLETDKTKLLQMVLVGQPELLDFISGPQMRQLRQRVAIHCNLEYITREEIDRYIARRLFIAGDKGHIRFTQRAIKKIYKASNGVPRLINKICDYALTAGYIADDFTIGPRYVKKAIEELGDLAHVQTYPSFGQPGRWWHARHTKLVLTTASCLFLFIAVVSLNYFFELPVFTSGKKTEFHSDLRSALPKETVTVKIEPLKQGFNESIPKETPYTENSFPSPFALQLGSFKSLEGVVRAVYFYKERDVEAHWHQLDLGAKGKWYRLFTGQFDTKEAAQKFKADYGLLKSIVLFAPWSVLVGQTNSSEDLNHIRSILRDNQYDSYDEKSGEGSHRVFTGIFINRERAKKLAQQISNLGILARVISR
jgi:general secretion pathway protein A